MKIFLIALSLFTFTHARQYIQCAHPHTWDRMVINLDGEQSKLFLTTGVHQPDEMRVVKKLSLQTSGEDFSIFVTNEGPVIDEVMIQNEYLNRALRYFTIDFKMTQRGSNYSQSFELGCFSSLHD